MASKPKTVETPAPALIQAPISESLVAATSEAVVIIEDTPSEAVVTISIEDAPSEAVVTISAAPVLPTALILAKPDMEKVMKTAEEFVAFGQGNMEAIVKSSQIWAAGVQDLSKQVAANAQSQFDETVSAFKALTGVKSLQDAFALQTSFARAALEKTVSESSKLTDASLKLTEQALAPITARVTTAVESFSKAA